MDATERRFLVQIGRTPDDAQLREVYADWLEERGELPKATFLRTQLAMRRAGPDDPQIAALSRELEATFVTTETTWRAQVADTPLENCNLVVRCPKRWDALAATDRPGVRSCDACSREVFYCATAEELAERAACGECIVVNPTVVRLPTVPRNGPMVMGIVAVQPPPDLRVKPPRDPPPPPPPKQQGVWSRLWSKLRGS